MKTAIFLLNTSAGRFLIDPATIMKVEALSNYCRLHFADGHTMVVARLLKWFEEKLSGYSFARINRSQLVNTRFLKSNKPIGEGFVLINGDYIRLSRRKRKMIISRLQVA
jgi:two-component system, LytTR family, response regulator